MLKHIIALTAALMMIASAASAAPDTLRVGTSGQAFPFSYSEGGKLRGFEIDVMRAIAGELGIELEFVAAEQGAHIAMLDAASVDTIASQIKVSPEMRARYLFTQPYIYDGAQVAVKRGNRDIHGVADLKGKQVAVIAGSGAGEKLRALPFGEQIAIQAYNGGLEQETALGKVDAFVMERTRAGRAILENPLPLELVGAPFTESRYALPFQDNAAGRALLTQVDDALTTLKEDGTLSALSREWFGIDVTLP